MINETDIYCQGTNREIANPYDLVDREGYEWLRLLWDLSNVFLGMATVLTLYLVLMHYSYWHKPRWQRFIVRILGMVPVYAFASWLALRYPQYTVYFTLSRDFYEAFVLYSFFSLLLQYLGANEADQRQRMQNKPNMQFPFPLGSYSFNPRGRSFLLNCKIGCMQYFVIVRPFTNIITMILQATDVLCPETIDFIHPQLYLTFLNLTSVSVAMYALVTFYLVVKDDMEAHRPLYKFLAIKFILFFSFWQAIGFSILVNMELIEGTEEMTAEEFCHALENCLICAEMLCAAVVHVKAFSHKENVLFAGARTNVLVSFVDSLDPHDIIAEIRQAPADIADQSRRNQRISQHPAFPERDFDNPFEVVNMIEMGEDCRKSKPEGPKLQKSAIIGPDVYGDPDTDSDGDGEGNDEQKPRGNMHASADALDDNELRELCSTPPLEKC